MNSKKSGKNGPWFKAASVVGLIYKNCKLELLIVLLGLLWTSFSWRCPSIERVLSNYFTESRCAGIAGFAAIVVGIYVTVWSVFATSASRINAELLKNRVEKQLFFLIGVGVSEALITVMWCIFVPNTISHYAEIMAMVTLLTVGSLVKFVILVMLITKLNIKYIVQEIDEECAQRIEMRVKLDEIYYRIVDGKK